MRVQTFTTMTPQGWARQPWADGKMAYDSPALLGALGRLGLKNYRYPGGSIGNHWDLESDRMCPLALNCTAYPATCEFNKSVDDARKAFPEGSFSVNAFYDFIEATGAAGAVLTINVIDCQPSLENATKFVAEAAERGITLRVEIGNESCECPPLRRRVRARRLTPGQTRRSTPPPTNRWRSSEWKWSGTRNGCSGRPTSCTSRGST